MRSSIRARLTTALTGLAVALLLVLGWRSFTLQRAQALDSQSQIAQRVSTDVTAFLQQRENKLRILTELHRPGLHQPPGSRRAGHQRAHHRDLSSEHHGQAGYERPGGIGALRDGAWVA